MRGRAGIHEPITTAPICAGVGVGVEGVQQSGVDLRRRGHAIVAWRPAVLRCGVEGLVRRWSRTQDAGVRSPGYRHGVGVDDSSPGILSHSPGRRGHVLLLGTSAWATVTAATAATLAASVAAASTGIAAGGRRSGRAWGVGVAAVGEDAVTTRPKSGGRRLRRVDG